MKKQLNLLLFLFLIPLMSFSNDDFTITKQKNIKKSYTVNANVAVATDNKYGTVFVTTWNEDKVEFDITIKVSGDNENWVNQRLNDISIDINAMTNRVTAKTNIENTNNNSNGRNNSFEINYVIKIPKNGSVDINNKYGNITTTDLYGPTNLSCKYGKITSGKLNNTNNSILIEYCNGSSISYLKSGSITARYSSLAIDEVSKLYLTSDYSDTTIGESDDVKYISKYGAVKIRNVNTLDGQGNYLTIKVGTISNQLRLQTKYSNIDIGMVQAKANNVTVNSSYTGIKIGFDPNYAFDFDVTLKYADLKYDSDFNFSSKTETNNSKSFKGFYKRKGINTVTVTSDYGNIALIKKQ